MIDWVWDLLVNMHWGAVGQIILIDILLGGDNAVVIALACRNLPHNHRTAAIFWGTAAAIALRVVLICFAMYFLQIPFLKVVGAVLLLYIGTKLLLPESEEHHDDIKASSQVFGAIRTIVIADLVMSIDNVIAIAGAAAQAHEAHQVFLVVFGLVVSVPFIVGGSQIVLKIIDRFPIIVWFGGGLLGWIAGGMFVTDKLLDTYAPWLVDWHYAASIVGAAIVVFCGWFFGKLVREKNARRRAEREAAKQAS